MTLKESARAIKQFVNGRRAFIEVTTGPPPPRVLELDDSTSAFPIGTLGNRQNIEFGMRLLAELRIPTDAKFAMEATQQGRAFNHLLATVYVGLHDNAFADAVSGSSQQVNRFRALVALYTGGEHSPILRLQWNEKKLGAVEFLAPAYRGIGTRHDEDLISPAFVRICATERLADDRLHLFIGTLEQIHAIDDPIFKMARYYSLLEAMTGALKGQFETQSKKPAARTAIRFALGYFVERDVPRFTIEPNDDFEFDHIEFAGRVRDKLFHGGGRPTSDDLTAELRPALRLMNTRPDMVCHLLRRDSEQLLSEWAGNTGVAWRAEQGEVISMPARNPNYDGKELLKPLLTTSTVPKSAILSILVKVVGADIGAVRLSLQGFNPTPS